jgi:hypothetical protein
MEEHARIEVWYNVVEVEGRFRVEGWYNTKGRDDLEILITFVNKGKVSSLRANTKIWRSTLALHRQWRVQKEKKTYCKE